MTQTVPDASSLGKRSAVAYTRRMALPSFLIDPLRSALAAQGLPVETIKMNGDINAMPIARQVLMQNGFPAEALDENGRINAVGLIAGFVDEAEIRTAWSDPVVIKLRDYINSPSGPPNAALALLQPMLQVRGAKIGTLTYAPYGSPDDRKWQPYAVVAGLIGVGAFAGAVLGAAVQKRKRRLGKS